MKKLIKLNIIMWLIVYIIPTVVNTVPVVVTNIYEETISIVIGEEEQISSRSSTTQRLENLHISEEGLNLLKKCEGIDLKAIKYTGEQYYTIGHRTLSVLM